MYLLLMFWQGAYLAEGVYKSKCNARDALEHLQVVLMHLNIFSLIFAQVLANNLQTWVTTCIFVSTMKHLERHLDHWFP